MTKRADMRIRRAAAALALCAMSATTALPAAVLVESVGSGRPTAAGAAGIPVPRSGSRYAPAARVLVIAHRGFSAVAPENTVPAMTAAVRAGADLVEFDVQRTFDGHLVVVHDPTFARTTDIPSVFPGRQDDPVGTFTLAEVRRLDAGSWKGSAFEGTRVPTLDEVLTAVTGTHTGVLLELKDPSLYVGYETQVAHALARHGMIHSPRVYVHSFDASSLARFHAVAPSVPLGLITDTGTVASAARQSWLGTVNPTVRMVSDAGVDAVQARHLKVFAWPPSTSPATPSQVERLVDDGVDGLITDDPVQARQQIVSSSAASA